jgi:hypothetical protein
MAMDYRKVNSKVILDSYPMPTIEKTFEQFDGAAVFSVLDLNSAYYQIPFSLKSGVLPRSAPHLGYLNLISCQWESVYGVEA